MGNIARNEHTGALLKSKPPTTAYRDGWVKAFGKKTAYDWAELEGIKNLKSDGWDQDGTSLDKLISFSEFNQRANYNVIADDA